MKYNEVIEQIKKIEHKFRGTNWIIGGSASLLLRNKNVEVKDIDIIQISGERVIFNKPYESRLLSMYYPDCGFDIHYLSDQTDNMPNIVQKITPALLYLNMQYNRIYGWKVIRERPLDLVNWLLYVIPAKKGKWKYGRYPDKKEINTLSQLIGEDTVKFIEQRILYDNDFHFINNREHI